jgi:hypothetical protein
MNHGEVIYMQRRMRDYLDDKSHSQAGQLENAFQRLEDDVQVQKNSLTIRDDLKQIESILNSMDDNVMSHPHIDELEDWVRDKIQKIN